MGVSPKATRRTLSSSSSTPSSNQAEEIEMRKRPSSTAVNDVEEQAPLVRTGSATATSTAATTAATSSTSIPMLFGTLFVVVVLIGGARSFLGSGEESSMMTPGGAAKTAARTLQIATWNIAAINNNPFEYWITYDANPKYEEIMVNIEKFLEDPGDKDVLVPEVFTQDMFNELDGRLSGTAGWTSVKSYWEEDFSKRKIVSDFMKDPTLGSKRLASMPDRYTNTINDSTGKQFFRPTVINMYAEDLSTQDIWWKKWEAFMFDTKISISGSDGTSSDLAPYEMLKPISKTKYPVIEEQEATDSLPLQTMCGAIFDAILVHMMNEVSDSPADWQDLKKTMVENLNQKKVPHTLEILKDQYQTSDIITLQEVSLSFVNEAKAGALGDLFHVFTPADLDSVRDQNSVIFLNVNTFNKDSVVEISDKVNAALPQPGGKPPPVAPGDILAILAETKDGIKYMIGSFHGDTNGLATIPVTDAMNVVAKQHPEYTLIFGLDANTYEHATPGKQQDVQEYATKFTEYGYSSCWGTTINPANYTTFNARTYLQPQLNKACKKDEKRQNGDVNPKDFILFDPTKYSVQHTWKDNTGKKSYTEDMAFPTLDFPSDHGILATILQSKE